MKFLGVSRSKKFVHYFPLSFQPRLYASLRIEFALVSWVVNFRVFRSKATRAKHKTTVTIITGSNYASANNTIGSLIQFHCVHACMSCATHANNPFHQRRKFHYRNGCASADYLDKHLKISDLISWSLRALYFQPASRSCHACVNLSRLSHRFCLASTCTRLMWKARFDVAFFAFGASLIATGCFTGLRCELVFRFRKYIRRVSRFCLGEN